jgi:hypothetical protein
VIGDKNGVAPDRLDGFHAPAACDFHGVTSCEGDGKTGEISDVGERGWGCAAVAKMHMADLCAAQILFEFAKNDSIRREVCSLGSGGLSFHRTLR